MDSMLMRFGCLERLLDIKVVSASNGQFRRKIDVLIDIDGFFPFRRRPTIKPRPIDKNHLSFVYTFRSPPSGQ